MIVWVTDLQGTLTVSEGGGLRGLGRKATENVGMSLADFGDSDVWRIAFPAALDGMSTITASVFDGHAYLNFCAPRRDGRGCIVGVSGFSWEVGPDALPMVSRALSVIAEELEGRNG